MSENKPSVKLLGGAKNLIYFEGSSAVVFQKGHGNAINHCPLLYVWLSVRIYIFRVDWTAWGFVFNAGNPTVEKDQLFLGNGNWGMFGDGDEKQTYCQRIWTCLEKEDGLSKWLKKVAPNKGVKRCRFSLANTKQTEEPFSLTLAISIFLS